MSRGKGKGVHTVRQYKFKRTLESFDQLEFEGDQTSFSASRDEVIFLKQLLWHHRDEYQKQPEYLQSVDMLANLSFEGKPSSIPGRTFLEATIKLKRDHVRLFKELLRSHILLPE